MEMKIRDIVRPILQEVYQSDGWNLLYNVKSNEQKASG